MKPMQHQVEFSQKLYDKLKEYGFVYLAGKPRSGKTLTAILACEKCNNNINNILVLTKKNAIEGWTKTINVYKPSKKFYVTNYEQASKLKPEYDLVIIDESHNIGTFPKPSLRWRYIKNITKNIPHIHLSGTAIIESPSSIYHQMNISKYTPFPFRSFYEWHNYYGKPYVKHISGRAINMYDKVQPHLFNLIDKFTIYMTQEDAGISSDLQAQDELHYIELSKETKELYNDLQKKRYKVYNDIEIIGDTTMKLRIALHQIEGGAIKVGDKYYDLGNTEKIDYIKKNFGDTKDIGIMCHFVGEANKLRKHFKKANIYSSSAHAEGVDLSHLKHFIIYSADYSGAKFVQRRERIVNVNGSNSLKVHHLLVKKAISEQVYKLTSNKMDFNDSTYVKETI